MGSEHCRERVRELVDEYRRNSGRPDLSIRGLAERMRAAGVLISHGTLQNMLKGATNPDRSTLRALAWFFEVPEYYFDAAERPASIMGRIGKLDARGLDAVERLLTDLDTEAGHRTENAPEDSPGPGNG